MWQEFVKSHNTGSKKMPVRITDQKHKNPNVPKAKATRTSYADGLKLNTEAEKTAPEEYKKDGLMQTQNYAIQKDHKGE
jgi:hypothetical protein